MAATDKHSTHYFAILSKTNNNVISLNILGLLVDGKKPILLNITSLQYAVANAEPPAPAENETSINWVSIISSKEEIQTNVEVPLNNNQYLYLRGSATGYYIDDDNRFSISSTGNIYLYGNILSLIHSSNFNSTNNSNSTTLPLNSMYNFRALFKNNIFVQNAENMYIPALTNMRLGAFLEFFMGCTGLTGVPYNAAASWGESCYLAMFLNCTTLNAKMDIPVNVKVKESETYIMCDMYNGCINFAQKYDSFENIGYSAHCFERMFMGTRTTGNIKLSNNDVLKSYSCAEMYQNCRNLTNSVQNAPLAFNNTTVSEESDHACSRMYHSSNMYNLSFYVVTKTAPSIFEEMALGSNLRYPPNYSELTLVERAAFRYAFSYCTLYDLVGVKGDNTAMSFGSGVVLKESACEGMFYGSKCNTGTNGRIMQFSNISTLGEKCFKDAWKGATIGNQQVLFPLNIDYPAECFSGAFANSTANLYSGASEITGVSIVAKVFESNACYEMFKSSAQKYIGNITTTGYIQVSAFESMFDSCKSLITCGGIACTGNVYATGCKKMFADSTITNLPFIYITNQLGTSAMQEMFDNCKSLDINMDSDANSYIFATVDGNTISTTNPRNVITFYGTSDGSEASLQEMFKNCSKLSVPIHIKSTSTNTRAFYRMFSNCTSLTTGGDIYVDSIGSLACQEMYLDCRSLETTGTIKVTNNIGGNGCYYMYKGCTKLKTALTITASTCGSSGCENMYRDCTNLETSGVITFNIVLSNGCKYMFRNTGLTGVPMLKVNYCGGTTEGNNQGNYCFHGMFMECSKLTYMGFLLPTLKIITNYACYQMFKGCNNLILGTSNSLPGGFTNIESVSVYFGFYTDRDGNRIYEYSQNTYVLQLATLDEGAGPVAIPAIKLAPYCFSEMFANCNSISSTPYMNNFLSLAEGCFSKMFYNCEKLSEYHTFTPRNYKPQKRPATAPNPATGYVEILNNNGVIIYSNTDAYVRRTAENEWEVCEQSDTGAMPLVVLDPTNFSISILSKNCCNAMFAGCTTLVKSEEILVDVFEEGACNAMFMNCTNLETLGEIKVKRIDAYGAANMFYNCLHLLKFFNDSNGVPALFNNVTQAGNYAFLRCFMNCYALEKTVNIQIRSMSEGIFAYMYANCIGITENVILGAETNKMTTAKACFSNMFRNCISLTKVTIYCNSVHNAAFENMFMNCSYLNTATLHIENTSNNKTYSFIRMFYNCVRLSDITYNCPEVFSSGICYEWLYGVVSSGGKFRHHINISQERIKIRCHTTVPEGWELSIYAA